jgi:hypothetical protein
MLSRIVGMGKSGLLPPEQLSALKAAIKMGTLGAGKLAFVCCHAILCTVLYIPIVPR